MDNEVRTINEKKKKKIDSDFVNFDISTAYEDSSLLVVTKRKEPLVVIEEKSNTSNESSEDSETKDNEMEALKEEAIATGYIFAEEIDDDDEEIYRTDAIDQALMKEKHRSYMDISSEIDLAINSFGLEGRLGLDLLSMMQFSRIARTNLSKEEVAIVFKAISNPELILEKGEEETITANEKMLDILSESKSHPDKPLFVYVTNIKPSEVIAYFKPFYDYFDNPDGENYILVGSKTYLANRNIYFMFSPIGEEEITLIPRKLLRYISKLNVKLKAVEENEPKPCYISLSQLRITLTDSNAYQLSEESWKKIDRLVDTIGSVNGYILQNKIINRLENSATVYLSSDYVEDDALDLALSNNLITEAIVTKDKKAMLDAGILDVLDTYFGLDKMNDTREIIKSYLSVKGEEGGKKK